MATRAKRTALAPELVSMAPGEEVVKNMDFKDKVPAGVTISSIASVTIDPPYNVPLGNDLQVITQAQQATKAQFKFGATTPNKLYVVTVFVNTTDGQKAKGEGKIRVDK